MAKHMMNSSSAHGIMTTYPEKSNNVFKVQLLHNTLDGMLLDKMQTHEMASIIRKINWCYQKSIAMGGVDIRQSEQLSKQIYDNNAHWQ
jgi:hypothetical protein